MKNYIVFFTQFSLRMMLLCLTHTYGQQLPPIGTFKPSQYQAGDQNWAISQSKNQTIYVANNHGLLAYNGASWKLYPTPNNTILRTVKVVEDKIFTGSYMDFGFWKANVTGHLEYTSLVNILKNPLTDDEEFWDIQVLDNWVLFQSLDNIYIYNTETNIFNIISTESRIHKMFRTENAIYFQTFNEGLYKIQNGKKKLIIPTKAIRDYEIVDIYNIDNDIKVLTREHGFFTLNNFTLSVWNIPANIILKSTSVYNSIHLKNGDFLLGTISNGVYQISSKGNVTLQVNQRLGLNNNTVLSLFEDANSNIWLGLDNGINVLNLNSPIKVYKDQLGQIGTVYTTAKTQSHIYLGTNQGLFYKSLKSNNDFALIPGTKGQVWALKLMGNTLLCGHDKGTFSIVNNKAILISDNKGTWCFRDIPNQPDKLLQGSYKGVSIIQYNTSTNTWEYANKVSGFDMSSRYLEFVDAHTLLVSHEYKGVFKLKLNAQHTSVESIKKLPMGFGILSSLSRYKNDVTYSYSGGVFSYDTTSNRFVKNENISRYFKNDSLIFSTTAKQIPAHNLWIFSNDKLAVVQPNNLSQQSNVTTIPLPVASRKGKLGYENVLHLQGNTYLLGVKDGYLTLDLNKQLAHPLSLQLTRVINSELHHTKRFQNLAASPVFNNNNNSIAFSFAVPNYNQLLPTLYSYKLSGMYNNWSTWSSKPNITFDNLPQGDYIFQVKSKVGNKALNNTISYSFSIRPPWYTSFWAILLYSICFVCILVCIQLYNRRHYNIKQQKLMQQKQRELEIEKLESQKQIMALNNKNLKLDIENKNRELGLSTMNLVKRNELLNAIKIELNNITKLTELHKVVTLINKNLNPTKDWKLFEEAFNNADKDFLKTIKHIHPNLTSNDLRLCAYLRLNLSSKEIAPLLNISPRSVEVKRYRLRKKMELDSKTSLTDYILKI